MNNKIHQNISALIARMENALQREDLANVLHSSASIFETLAKDVIATPDAQDKTLKQLFEAYKQKTNLPKEILDYILDIYNSRNKTPLAGHGSTQTPNITKENAIVLCELTKAFVYIEYRSRDSKKMGLPHDGERPDTTPISLTLNENGLDAESDIELRALLTEALYGAQKGVPLKFDVIYMPVVNIENILNRAEFQNPSPETRITKVKILKLLDHEKEIKKIIDDALSLVSTESILNMLSTEVEYLLEIINGVPRVLLYSIIEKGMTGIDIFRKNTRLSASFYLNEEEIQTTLGMMGLQSEVALMGNGWDFFDLPITIRFQKAIPAMLIEVATNRSVNDLEISLDEILYPGYWNIGLR